MNAFIGLPDLLMREVKSENEETISLVVRCNGGFQECLGMVQVPPGHHFVNNNISKGWVVTILPALLIQEKDKEADSFPSSTGFTQPVPSYVNVGGDITWDNFCREDDAENLGQASGSSPAVPWMVSTPLSLGPLSLAGNLSPSEFAEGCVLIEGSCSYLHP